MTSSARVTSATAIVRPKARAAFKLRDAGYNDWADAHQVINLYPQATPWLRLADPSQITGNPKGCWDWWGYSGDKYLGRDGKQMRAVRAMIARMLP